MRRYQRHVCVNSFCVDIVHGVRSLKKDGNYSNLSFDKAYGQEFQHGTIKNYDLMTVCKTWHRSISKLRNNMIESTPHSGMSRQLFSFTFVTLSLSLQASLDVPVSVASRGVRATADRALCRWLVAGISVSLHIDILEAFSFVASALLRGGSCDH